MSDDMPQELSFGWIEQCKEESSWLFPVPASYGGALVPTVTPAWNLPVVPASQFVIVEKASTDWVKVDKDKQDIVRCTE